MQVIYLSMAPKSNAMELAYMEAKADAVNSLAEPVPLVIRNAPTKLMADLHYGEGYQYAHDTKEKVAAMQCLPDSLKDKTYYHLRNRGWKPGTRSGCGKSGTGRRPMRSKLTNWTQF